MSIQETDILSDLIRVKRECLVQLRDMGRKQQSVIDEGDMKGLMELLSAKQRPLVSLQRIERALAPFRDQDPEKRVWRSAAARSQCAEQLQQCETLLAEIVGLEKSCEAALIIRRDEAAERLQETHLAGNARNAYLPQTDAVASQINLLSEQ